MTGLQGSGHTSMDMVQSIVQSNPWLWIALVVVFVALIFVHFLRRNAPTAPGGWKGPFYVNPADPALFVRSRWGFGRFRGYTFNFGHRWAWVILAALLVLSLAPIWYVTVALRQVFALPSN